MTSLSYVPFKDDTFILVDVSDLSNSMCNLPLDDSQTHYMSEVTVGVWKIKGRRYNGFNSLLKLYRHFNPF